MNVKAGMGLAKPVSRREALRLAAVGGLAMAMAACGGTASGPSGGGTAAAASGTRAASASSGGTGTPASAGAAQGSTAGSAANVLPAYIPFNGPKPDLPGTATGVDAGYFAIPKTLVKSVQETPGKGDEITALTIVVEPPKPMEQNTAWQAVNKALGATLKINFVAASDYRTRLNTTAAGDDLPDTLYNVQANLANAPDFMAAKCADLTPYLAGNAIKDYPNLANFPTAAWKQTVFSGRIYAVPVPRNPFATVTIYRHDMFDQLGLQPPTNGDDFTKVLKALTQPPNRYAIAGFAGNAMGLTTGSVFTGLFGVPNNWRNAGGKLTKDFETDEYKTAVGKVKDMWTAGYFHPNSITDNFQQAGVDMRSGKAAIYTNTWGSFTIGWDLQYLINQQARIYPMPVFNATGGKAIYPFGNSNMGMTFLKKATPDRIKLILRVMNFLAAPFGSQEAVLVQYGVEGVDYTLDQNGNIVQTDQGKKEAVQFNYITAMAPVLYDPINGKEFATVGHDWEQATAPLGIEDPITGLYSAADAKNGVTLAGDVYAGVQDIVLGRRPLTDLDQLVKDWRSKGGDAIRAEYEKLLAG